MEQRTPEWYAARLGKATASRIADIVARTRSGYSTSRANYAAQLVCERLTGAAAEAFVSSAMAWGAEKEPEAQRLYAFERDVEVVKVGFIDHPRIPMSGASPDGLVGEAGLVEVRQDAQRRVYSLRPQPLAEIDQWLGRYRALWEQRLDALHTEVARGKRERRSTR